MAKKNTLNLALLAAICAANSGSPGYTYVSEADAKPLLEKGFIEQNPSADAVNDKGERQTRATDAGIAFSKENPPAAESAAKEPKAAPVFALATVDVPEIKRGGNEKPSVWPFDKLGVKGNAEGAPNSFFVPSTPDRPDPVKALASTVSGATRKYSVQDGTKTVKAKDGSEKTVPNMKAQRKFVIRAVQDGAPWGEQYKGVAGAAILRTL